VKLANLLENEELSDTRLVTLVENEPESLTKFVTLVENELLSVTKFVTLVEKDPDAVSKVVALDATDAESAYVVANEAVPMIGPLTVNDPVIDTDPVNCCVSVDFVPNMLLPEA
jgi:hypothetical protein